LEEPEAWAAIEDIEEPDFTSNPGDIMAAVGHSPAWPGPGHGQAHGELYNSEVSRHMSPFGKKFTNYKSIPLHPITAADKQIFYAVGMGDLRIKVPNGESFTPIVLKDVLHALDMGTTIVSISQITQSGCKVVFDVDVCHIFNKVRNHIGAICANKHGLYKAEHTYAASILDEQVDIATMHRSLMHIAPDSIRKMVKKGIIKGVQLIDDGATVTCEACKQAKATHKEIQKECEASLSVTADAVSP
jgi:hypothetical protein